MSVERLETVQVDHQDYGGDEFLLVLPGLAPAQALRFAQRAQKPLNRERVPKRSRK